MQVITGRDRHAGPAGTSLTDVPYPHAAENDVVVRVHAAGFTRAEPSLAPGDRHPGRRSLASRKTEPGDPS